MNTPILPTDVRDRVFAAAADLFEQSGRQAIPTVDRVRRLARVDMNAASTAMREWRRQQTALAAPVAIAVPEVVTQANTQALAALWLQAQELANQSLREAHSAWDAERAELEQMRAELAEAFENQAGELELAQTRIVVLEKEARDTASIAADELSKMRAGLATATTRTERAEATAAELEKRVADLRGELDRAHADADQVRNDLKKVATEADSLRAEIAGVRAKMDAAEHAHEEHRKEATREAQRWAEKVIAAQHERDLSTKEAATARENAARLAGQVDALQAQHSKLLGVLRKDMGNALKGG